MPLVLSLRVATTLPIEVEGILPEVCEGKSLAEIERLTILHGKDQLSLAEIFRASGAVDDGELVFEGDCRGVHWIGAKMTRGRIRILGNSGRHLGSQMDGGEITLDGSCGDWLGPEMRGGKITVRHDAGHQVGAAYRGSARGMRGGEILVHGNAGNEIGARMRRGLIAIAGKSGDAPGYAMLAGTILLFGEGGKNPGGNMRRGTIAYLGESAPELLPTFRAASRHRPIFMNLLLSKLGAAGFPIHPRRLATTFHFHTGDHLEGGRGEILIAASGGAL